MTTPVIEVTNVTKLFRLGTFQSLKALIKKLIGRNSNEGFKALDNVTFSVNKGEVIGIIGHNGAGKSTLLKLLCNITSPTEGKISVKGRIAPLIEVGAGLVPDMTGRENIYLNASILGLTRKEIEGKIDEIIAFSELQDFIDTPIKRYSSGMQVRLGYAIATAVDAEILIVDEVLAVGDLQFQRKSIERMQKLIHDADRTILIVGHNIRQLERVCSRMILLDHGKILDDGDPLAVTNRFFDMAAHAVSTTKIPTKVSGRIESSGELEMQTIETLNGDTLKATNVFEVGQPITIELNIESMKNFNKVDMAVAFHTPDLMNVGISPLTASLPVDYNLRKGSNSVRCHFKKLRLLPGTFMLKIGIKDQFGQMIWEGDNLRPLEIIPAKAANAARYSAITFVEFEADWEFISGDRAGRTAH